MSEPYFSGTRLGTPKGVEKCFTLQDLPFTSVTSLVAVLHHNSHNVFMFVYIFVFEKYNFGRFEQLLRFFVFQTCVHPIKQKPFVQVTRRKTTDICLE